MMWSECLIFNNIKDFRVLFWCKDGNYVCVTGDVVVIFTLDCCQKRNNAILTSHVSTMFELQNHRWKTVTSDSLLTSSPPSGQREDAQASELWLSCSCVCCRCTPPSSDSPGTLAHMSAGQTCPPDDKKDSTGNIRSWQIETFLFRNSEQMKLKNSILPPVWRPDQRKDLRRLLSDPFQSLMLYWNL